MTKLNKNYEECWRWMILGNIGAIWLFWISIWGLAYTWNDNGFFEKIAFFATCASVAINISLQALIAIVSIILYLKSQNRIFLVTLIIEILSVIMLYDMLYLNITGPAFLYFLVGKTTVGMSIVTMEASIILFTRTENPRRKWLLVLGVLLLLFCALIPYPISDLCFIVLFLLLLLPDAEYGKLTQITAKPSDYSIFSDLMIIGMLTVMWLWGSIQILYPDEYSIYSPITTPLMRPGAILLALLLFCMALSAIFRKSFSRILAIPTAMGFFLIMIQEWAFFWIYSIPPQPYYWITMTLITIAGLLALPSRWFTLRRIIIGVIGIVVFVLPIVYNDWWFSCRQGGVLAILILLLIYCHGNRIDTDDQEAYLIN